MTTYKIRRWNCETQKLEPECEVTLAEFLAETKAATERAKAIYAANAAAGHNTLIGKTLTNVELAADKKAVRFTVDGEQVIAKCDGDCCSETWIECVEMPAAGLPAKILGAT